MCFMSQPLATNSPASQSSNAGFTGGSPCAPMSSSTFERPMPKNCLHSRFTKTRAVSGFSFATIHSAKSRRVSGASAFASFFSDTARNPGSAGCIVGPLSSIQLPRGRTRTVRFVSDTTETMHLGIFAS